MTEEQKFFFFYIAIWAIVWVSIVAILKARQPKWEEEIESSGIPYLSKTTFMIGITIWWPVLLLLSPFYLLYRAVYKVSKPKNK